MKQFTSILAICCLIFTSACGDFLDEVPKSSVTTENYYKTVDDAIAATDAIYDYLISGYSPGGLWDDNFGGLFFNDYWELPELMSDNAFTKHSGTDFISASNFEIDAYNSRVRCLWRDFYQTISVCNAVIQKVPLIEMDETLQNQLIAEAKFFRALCYFDLTRFFGDVPVHTDFVEDAEKANIPRSPTEEIYPLIIEDLEYAENNLLYQSRLGQGRPYALSATALLARFYLTVGMKNNNKTYLEEAVKKAELVIPAFPLQESYADIFLLENRFKGERIWEANFNATLSQGWKGNQFLVRLLPNMDTSKGGPNNAQGWVAATEGLESAYEVGDKRKEVSVFTSFTYNDNSVEYFDAAYFCKYWDRVAEPGGNNSDATFPYLRTAEMYLIKAEALNEIHQGPDEEAKDALNKIRSRAGLSGTNATSYSDFKRAILAERRVEFAIEGHRWHDLVRMCGLEEFQQIVKQAKSGVNPTKTHFLFPVPQRERDVSNGVLTQNDGY